MKKQYKSFIICLFIGFYVAYGQADCSSALPVCTDAGSGGVVNGLGNDDFNGRDQSGCLERGLGVLTVETNSFWFRVKLAESGEFGFDIIPNDASEDWDFAVYGPNPTCGALGNPIACNYIKNSTTGNTGVGIDPDDAAQVETYESWMDVTAGEEYVVLINQYDGNNAGFSINWQGDVINNNTDPLDCSILVDLGPDRDLCTGQSTVLNATTYGTSVTYEWFKYNNSTGTFDPIVPAETTATLLVSTGGNYRVEVTDGSGTKSDDIVVTIHGIPAAGVASPMFACDSGGDGTEPFNLESRTNMIKNGQNNTVVTYHESEIFAKAGAVAQSSPYISNGTTIWARIENDANSNCYDVTSFDLVVNNPPTAVQVSDLQLCDYDNDGVEIFDLTTHESTLLNGQTGLLPPTYYENETNALDRKGWIVDPTQHSSGSATIWVRVEENAGSDCAVIITFDIEVLEVGVANLPDDILQCDDDNDGLYEFNLNALKDAEILGTQDPDNYEINYFATQDDADANNLNMVLSAPYVNGSPYAQETIYVRIQNEQSSDCYNTTSFTIQVFDSANPSLPADIPNLQYCDDMSDGDDTNGFFEFDLTEMEDDILNGQSQFVFDITYFVDAAYTNQINNLSTYQNATTNLQTIYVRVTNNHPNNINCFADTSFNIEVLPLPMAVQSPFELRQCDEDGFQDGFTDFDLAEADTFLTLGNNLLNVTYHLSPLDAADGINAQSKYPFSNATSSIMYARIEAENGCYRIVTVNLIVSTTSFPANYVISTDMQCDDDGINNGLHLFNLAQKRSEILAQFLPVQNLQIAFYRNRNDAHSESDRIVQEDAYMSEVPLNQTIWGRVESIVDGGCFGIAPVIELTVHPIPEFELDEADIVCLNRLPLIVSTFNANGSYTYEWTDELGNVVSQLPWAEINQGGIYKATAFTNMNCEFSREITITESSVATISQDDVLINNSTITILTDNENLGIGDYEFSIVDHNTGSTTSYQDTPVFLNVPPGEYTVNVREKNDCGLASVVVYVFGFPQFFTPNEDGRNDTWNVEGVDASLFPETSIYIYDRYGKMMTAIRANELGWNGMYNSKKALSSDYWYLAQITDSGGNIREYKGHFSLIRR